MEHIGMKLTEEHVRWAALGGSILGGGGGGSAKTGAEFGDLAVRFSQLELTPLDQIDPETVVVTASMVGCAAWSSLLKARVFVQEVSLLMRMEAVLRSMAG